MVPILSEIGFFLQAQNDFTDCFGNCKVLGKIGTDIESNTCSWLSVKCLEQSNREQKGLLEKYYGKTGMLI